MIGKVIQLILDVFRFHKFKIFVALVSAVIFTLIIFPYSDLGDLVSSKVSELSGNQVYLQFEGLSLNLIPQPGLEMESVFLETPYLPSLTVDSLSLSPSIIGLLSFKPGISAYARGFLDGKLSLSTRGGDKTKSGARKQIITLSTNNVDMSKLAKFAELPIPLKGKLTLDADGVIDPNFGEQPAGKLTLEIRKFEVISSTVPTSFGPVNVPGIAVSKLNLSGQLTDGRFTIDDGRIGQPNDDLHGAVKGDINLRVDRIGGQPNFNVSAYNLEVDLTASTGLQSKASTFLSLLDSYKQSSANGTRYFFRVSSRGCSTPPCMLPVH